MVEVSVIIPVYNVERYLKECLDSVVNQTFKDFEVICVNDGSTDSSLDILNDYSEKFKFIKVISQENGGLGSARNTGMKHVTGDYIYFLDSDDYISQDCLEKLYENIKANKSDIVFFKHAVFDDNHKIDYKKQGFAFEKIIEDVDFSNYTFTYAEVKKHVLNSSFSAWHKLYSREFLDKYSDFTFPQGAYEDVLFHVKAMVRAERISYVNDFLYFYRTNPDSIVHTNQGLSIFDTVKSVEEFLKDEGYCGEFLEEFKLFKITQLLNYMLISKSEEYFTRTKDEFSKISIDENSLLNDYKLNRFNLVLNSSSIMDYYFRQDLLVKEEFEDKIKKINKEKYKLKNQNKKLKNDNSKLKTEIQELKQDKNESKIKRILFR